MYQLIILPKALHSVERILNKLSWLSENFDNIIALPFKGALSGTYKLRIGDWRVIYSFDVNKHVITVHLVGHRRDIYKVP